MVSVHFENTLQCNRIVSYGPTAKDSFEFFRLWTLVKRTLRKYDTAEI